ncbi:hypothetical protein CW556_24530 [Salmonella enterica]|nr:hypothetical protein [Salmonella enterica]EBH7155377.1 hypothetical protein [Salmonella enterica]EMD2397931.1 hypothetical protein [Salmonella enterica]
MVIVIIIFEIQYSGRNGLTGFPLIKIKKTGKSGEMNIPAQSHSGAVEISRPSGKNIKKPRPVFRKKHGLFISTGYPVMFYGTAQRPG